MDIAVNTPLPDDAITDTEGESDGFDTNMQEERWTWPSETETTPIETQGRSVMDIAVSPKGLGNTPLSDDAVTDTEGELDGFDTNMQEERWTWPSETPTETQSPSVMDIAVSPKGLGNTPLPDTPTDFDTNMQEEKWTWPTDTDTNIQDNVAPINTEITTEFDSEMETSTRKRNVPENASKSTSLKRERFDSENEAIKWENQLNNFLKSIAKQKAEEKVINDKKQWEKMLKESIEESILKSKIAKADKIAFDIERNMVYSQPAQRKMQFNTINIHDKPRNQKQKTPSKNTIPFNISRIKEKAGKLPKEKRKTSLPKQYDRDQLSETKYGRAVLRNIQNRS